MSGPRSARRTKSPRGVEAGSACLARSVAWRPARCRRSTAPSVRREIGGIVDLYMRKMGNPAVLFDDIPGYPRGHRILANILTSVRRINLTLGTADRRLARSNWCAYLAQIHEGGAQTSRRSPSSPARSWKTSSSGKRHRHPENPDAALARARRRLLHRHRLHGDHEAIPTPAGSTTAPTACSRTDLTSRP